MQAFLSPFLSHPHPQTRRRLAAPVCTLTPPDDQVKVRFKRDATEEPLRSFLPTPPASESAPQTPNDRVLAQVRETMRRLGVEPEDATPAPPKFIPIDISRVNPLSAYVGALGAAAISFAAWQTLNFVISFFLSHPFTGDIYVVQRLSAVVRTGLVCLFALGSGISGVTALGLFLLGMRTTAAAITGEFRNEEESASQTQQQ